MTPQDWRILLAAYLIGSIPTAYIVTWIIKKTDIRRLGDGNVGGKNTFISVGRLVGVVVSLIDIGKGILSITLARHYSASEWVILLAGTCAILGHDFPIFLKFRGGQGMATMAGVFLMLFPLQMAVVLCTLMLTLLFTHNWNLSCAVACVLLVILNWIMEVPIKRFFYVIILLPSLWLRRYMQDKQAQREALSHR